MKLQEIRESRVPEPSWASQIGSTWYRGSEYNQRNLSNYISKQHDASWDKPPPSPVPQDVWDDFKAGKTGRLHFLTHWDFKVSKTYNGMSNWGYGIYFSNELSWARGYGDHILVANIEPAHILCISNRDFANGTQGTAGGEIKRYFDQKGIYQDWRAQASEFYKAIKRIDKTKKALYVGESANSGQLVVFDRNIITPKIYYYYED
jgi:hypothetical protein